MLSASNLQDMQHHCNFTGNYFSQNNAVLFHIAYFLIYILVFANICYSIKISLWGSLSAAVFTAFPQTWILAMLFVLQRGLEDSNLHCRRPCYLLLHWQGVSLTQHSIPTVTECDSVFAQALQWQLLLLERTILRLLYSVFAVCCVFPLAYRCTTWLMMPFV